MAIRFVKQTYYVAMMVSRVLRHTSGDVSALGGVQHAAVLAVRVYSLLGQDRDAAADSQRRSAEHRRPHQVAYDSGRTGDHIQESVFSCKSIESLICL